MNPFGARLRALRRAQGLTQADVGRALGVAASTVSMYESGKREPSLDTILGIARLLGAPLEALVGEAPGLTPDEARLLAEFRAMSQEGRRYLIASARLTRRAQAGSDTAFLPE